ncbi:hypothetical protein HMPREF1015_02699 [Bacillus smithii 7_3_47FAA]|uniref:Uncharacterized protein n=1 Tax=Bacillus smithii 7_3_47FAA TaxID=665952 RepID=G9QNF6_9BACI|nr:hypothetical protein HMPREF1015_02699 [Bacillus smithii 7_3_47FAA]
MSAQRSEKAFERVLSPPIDDSGGTVDLARAADKGWGIFHRTLSTLSTKRTSSGAGPHGNGRKRSASPARSPRFTKKFCGTSFSKSLSSYYCEKMLKRNAWLFSAEMIKNIGRRVSSFISGLFFNISSQGTGSLTAFILKPA